MGATRKQIDRICLAFRRELIWRRMPHGLLSPFYLWPWLSGHARTHRQIWWYAGRNWPRPVWLVVQLWQWLRWVCWHALKDTWYAVRYFGTEVQGSEGVAASKQALRVLKHALLWGIHPAQSYGFRLYRHNVDPLSYVYDCELPAYHAWRSRFRKPSKESERLLTEKVDLSARMASLGIPVPQTLGGPYPRSTPNPLKDLCKRHGSVFCKMAAGNQGRGAFAAWLEGEVLRGQTLAGPLLTNETEVDAAWRRLCELDRPVVQLKVCNHRQLDELADAGRAITLRTIMSWTQLLPNEEAEVICLSAMLFVPILQGADTTVSCFVVPVDALTGEIDSVVRWLRMSSSEISVCERLDMTCQRGDALKVPFWNEVMRWSSVAQSTFVDHQALAWDWIVTSSGPILLEGNLNWGVESAQIVSRSKGALIQCRSVHLDGLVENTSVA